MWSSSCLSHLGQKEGKSQGPAGARLPAQPTPSSARHTHRAADAGHVIVVKRRPAGVRVAVGGAPHVGVSGQNTPVHEAEREEAGYDPAEDDRASRGADGCLGSVRGCGWRNVRTRAGPGVLQPSGGPSPAGWDVICAWDCSRDRGRACRGLGKRPCTRLVCHK